MATANRWPPDYAESGLSRAVQLSLKLGHLHVTGGLYQEQATVRFQDLRDF